MDKFTPKELFEVDAVNSSFLDSVLKLSTKLTSDVTRPLFEKSYCNSKSKLSVVPLYSEISGTSSPPPQYPEVCSRCYTPQRADVLRSRLLRCHRSARSVRQLMAKKRSVLYKLSSRERMLINSHDQWSNILITRCRVCGLKARQLCPLPGPRPAPATRRQQTKRPALLQQSVATMNAAVAPSRKKKKNKNKKCEGGLVISEELKQEIQMTMGYQENNSTKKKRKSNSVQGSDSKSGESVSARLNNTSSEVIELDCVPSNGDSMLTPKSASNNSTQAKKVDSPNVFANNADQSKQMVTPRTSDTPRSKQASKLEQKHLKQSPSIGTKLVNKSSPATKKLVSQSTTPPPFKKLKSDVSTLDQDNIAQYGVPLLRINEVKKTQNDRKMQQKTNALKNAFKQSAPPKSSKSIKDFLNTLF